MRFAFLLFFLALQASAAIKFNGNGSGTQLLDMGSPASLDNVPNLTVSAWVFREGTNGATSIERIAAKTLGWILGSSNGTNGSNSLYFQVSYSTTAMVVSTGPDTLSTGALHHVAVTWSALTTTNSTKLYVDGVEVTTRTRQQNSAGTRIDDAAGLFTIGNVANGNAALNGSIAEIAVFTNVVSSAGIKALADPHLYRIPLFLLSAGNCMGWWPLDDGQEGGTIPNTVGLIRDWSGIGNHGTASNLPIYKAVSLSYP